MVMLLADTLEIEARGTVYSPNASVFRPSEMSASSVRSISNRPVPLVPATLSSIAENGATSRVPNGAVMVFAPASEMLSATSEMRPPFAAVNVAGLSIRPS